MSARLERSGTTDFLSWLYYELEPREGRAWAVARMVAACSLTVAVAMVFRIPEPTYMAYIVFLISKDETAATITTGVGGLAAATVAILATLALSLFDLSEPALRLPAMAAMTFLAMYSVRVFALGPITFLAGFVIVLLQSLVDDVPSPEAFTRITLWIWVVLFVPIVITVLLNLLFGASVEVLRERELKRIAGALANALDAGRTAIPLLSYRERIVELLEKKGGKPKMAGTVDLSGGALQALLNLLVLLEVATPAQIVRRGSAWAAELDSLCALIGKRPDTTHSIVVASPGKRPSENAADAAIEAAIAAIRSAVEAREAPAQESKETSRRLLAEDATSNPAHWQFAVKTTLAVMIVYSLYTLLDWPGLRTSIVTCFFVAFGSLGETVHKLTLRIVGALIGGALAGLCIVFVLPHCTDIGQLCLVIAVVSAGAGWIATSSERLAYAGLQIAFAFFIGVLQDYAPATDLTVLRDRVVGILLGNIVMTLVFSTLWPQSAAGRVRSAIGQSLRAVAALIKSPLDAEANRQRAARTLVAAEHFRILRAFELRLVPGHLPLERLVASLKKFALFEAWIFVLSLDQNARDHRQQDCHALSDWALAAAAVAESGGAWPEPPNLSPGCSEPLQKAQRAAVETVKEAQVIEGPA